MDIEIRICPIRRKCNKVAKRVYLRAMYPDKGKPSATCDHSHMCGDDWKNCKVKGISVSSP